MKIIKIKTLNETIEELGDKNYGVMDHTLADALRDEKENKKKVADMMVEAGKDAPVEERDAHTKGVKTPELKKMHLAESLFEDWNENNEELNESWNEDLVHDVYNALTDIAFDYYQNKNVILAVKDFEPAWEWFATHFEDDDNFGSEEKLNESINSNTSHAQDFISALRSAGFGDGFDQKLKIDTYGNGGTRIEFKDQGGTFTVTITDDKVILEGQDEGDAPFKKEFSTWEEFASEFESLYPGIPVRENKILVEKVKRYSFDKSAEIANNIKTTLNKKGINCEIDTYRTSDIYFDYGDEDEELDGEVNYSLAVVGIKPEDEDKDIMELTDFYPSIYIYDTVDVGANGDLPSSIYQVHNRNDGKSFDTNSKNEAVKKAIEFLNTNESLTEASYTRSDNKKMLVKPNRDPLVDVIQLTLTDGEWGYVKSPDGTITPSLLSHLSYDIHDVGVSFDKEGRYFVRVWDVSEEALQKVAEVAKQFNREYKIGLDKFAAGDKKWYCLIYLNEDTDFDDPYVDPEAEVNKEGIKGRGTKLRGNPEARHARDNEDLEDSQRYPIESPVPAQTGLMENTITGTLPPVLDKFLMDCAQMHCNFDYTDISKFAKRATKEELNALKQIRDDLKDGFDEDDPEVKDIFNEVEKIVKGTTLTEDISVNGSLMEDKISTDMIHDFKPEAGAAEETFNRILEADKMETFEFMLEDRFPNGVTTEELNGILSEESQWIYDQLGMKEYVIPDEDEE